jgi:hypothetical protein
MLALTESNAFLLSQRRLAKRQRQRKRQVRGAPSPTIEAAKNPRRYWVFARTSVGLVATVNLGFPPKREGVPPSENRIGGYSTTFFDQGVKKFLQALSEYD